MFGAFFGPGPDAGGTFEAKYRVFPVSFIDKPQLEYGDKVRGRTSPRTCR